MVGEIRPISFFIINICVYRIAFYLEIKYDRYKVIDMEDKKICKRIKELRESIGKSQTFIAKAINVAPSAIFRYESGHSDI